jgi:phosphate uptake regulator
MAGSTSRHIAEELDQLTQRLLEMAGLAEERVSAAMRGLVDRDRDLILDVITGDQALNALHLEIDHAADVPSATEPLTGPHPVVTPAEQGR